MPFYPYREERYQAELLKPREGWRCDTSPSAPKVFENGKILDRQSFDVEGTELVDQIPSIRRYAAYMFDYVPNFKENLEVSASGKNHYLVTGLSSFFTAIQHPDAKIWATSQQPILEDLASKTSADQTLSEFHKRYAAWAKEMAYWIR
jgi:hypothetical protein